MSVLEPIGRYAAIDFIDSDPRFSEVDRWAREALRKWALARIADVEQAKLDRNKAETNAVVMRDLLRELLPRIDELSDTCRRVEAACEPDAGNKAGIVVDAARALVGAIETGTWSGQPLSALQALSARMVDLQEAVREMGLPPPRRKR